MRSNQVMVIPALEASLESAAEPEGDAAALWPWDLQGTPPKARSVSTGGGAQATTSREEGGGGTPDTSREEGGRAPQTPCDLA
jgi:hypothetical protein